VGLVLRPVGIDKGEVDWLFSLTLFTTVTPDLMLLLPGVAPLVDPLRTLTSFWAFFLGSVAWLRASVFFLAEACKGSDVERPGSGVRRS